MAARRRCGLLLRALLVLLLVLLLPPSVAKKQGRAGRKKAGVRKGAKPDAAQLSQLVQQGIQLAAAGKTREAERQLAAVLEHDPTNYQALGNRANLLPELGRAAEGVAALETATRLYGTHSAYYNLGVSLVAAGDHAKGLSAMRRAHGLTQHQPAARHLAQVGIATSLQELGRSAEAAASYIPAVAYAREEGKHGEAVVHAHQMIKMVSRAEQEGELSAERVSALLGELEGALDDRARSWWPAANEVSANGCQPFTMDGVLNAWWAQDPRIVKQICEALAAGRFVVIPDALEPQLAASLTAELAAAQRDPLLAFRRRSEDQQYVGQQRQTGPTPNRTMLTEQQMKRLYAVSTA
eukprot:COSAG04_NODE_3285_length_2973_cov_3.607168_2_plen_353_part_00